MYFPEINLIDYNTENTTALKSSYSKIFQYEVCQTVDSQRGLWNFN